jgi:hypothetical protein
VRVTQAGSAPVTVGVDALRRQRDLALFRQVAGFGDGGFPYLRPPDRADLIGRRPSELRRAVARGASATLDEAGTFAAVDRTSPVLPVNVTGEVRGTDAGEVAIALNGRIGAVAQPVTDGGRRAFAAVLPPALLRDGPNRLEVFGVARRDGRPVLTPLLSAGASSAGSFRLVGDALRAPDGRRLEITGGGVRGYVDRSERDDQLVRLNGWAVDTQRGAPVDRIVVFAGDRLLAAGAPSLPRPDIGDQEGVPPARLGFGIEVAAERLKGKLRVFAVHGGAAAPIGFYCAPGTRQVVGC